MSKIRAAWNKQRYVDRVKLSKNGPRDLRVYTSLERAREAARRIADRTRVIVFTDIERKTNAVYRLRCLP